MDWGGQDVHGENERKGGRARIGGGLGSGKEDRGRHMDWVRWGAPRRREGWARIGAVRWAQRERSGARARIGAGGGAVRIDWARARMFGKTLRANESAGVSWDAASRREGRAGARIGAGRGERRGCERKERAWTWIGHGSVRVDTDRGGKGRQRAQRASERARPEGRLRIVPTLRNGRRLCRDLQLIAKG